MPEPFSTTTRDARLVVRVTEDEIALLDREADRQGIHRSAVVRRALAYYFAPSKAQGPRPGRRRRPRS